MMENMRRWDGYDTYRRYKMPKDQIEYWDMTIDDCGNIFYLSYENPRKLYIWCAATRLSMHMHYLCRFNAAVDTWNQEII